MKVVQMFICFRRIAVVFIVLLSPVLEASSFKELQFLPPKGTNILGIGIRSSKSEENIEVYAPGNQKNDFYKVDQNYQWLDFKLGHSLTSKLYVDLIIPYSIYNREVTEYLEGSTIEGEKFGRNRSGIGDPTISGKQRVRVTLLGARLNIDTIMSYSPSAGERKYPSTSKTGNIKRGGDSYTLVIEAGSSFTDLQLAFYGKFKYFDATKGKDLFDDSTVTTRSFHSQALGGRGLAKVRDNFYLEASVEFGQFNTQKIQNLGNQSQISSKEYQVYTIGLRYIFREHYVWKLNIEGYNSTYSLASGSLSMVGDSDFSALNSEIIYEF